MSKGSKRRPMRVSAEKFRERWDKIFKPRPKFMFQVKNGKDKNGLIIEGE